MPFKMFQRIAPIVAAALLALLSPAPSWDTAARLAAGEPYSGTGGGEAIQRTGWELDDLTEFDRRDLSRGLETLFAAPWSELPGGAPEPWSMDGLAPYVQRYGIAHDVGDGIGYGQSFTTLEFMTPIRGDLVWDNLFADCRFLIRNDATVGANLGIGYRHYSLAQNRIWGVNVFYDYRQTDFNDFKQLGVGLESLGALIDFRANAYIPDVYETRGFVPNRFREHILIINRDEVAMTGGDVEAGVTLLDLDRVQTRVFGGGYHFDGHGNQNATGWRARAEATLDQKYWLDVAVQDDQVFGTTVVVGLAFRHAQRFPPPNIQAHRPMDHWFFRRRGDAAARNIAYRLSAPIERLQNIVLSQEPKIATDGAGTPLNFLHVVEGGAGDGSFEDPYGTLTDALNDAAAGNSIIYTPFGGDYVEDITLVSGAIVLSNGPVQNVQTQDGLKRLPFSGTSRDLMDLPTLTGSVTMADDSRFSGFDVSGGLTATGVTNITVDNSVISHAAGDAVVLSMVDAATLDTLILSSTGGRGLLLEDASADVLHVTVTSATDDGVEVTSLANDRTVAFTSLVVEDASAEGLDINLDGAGNLDVSLSGQNMLTAVGNALDASLGGASAGDLVLALDNTTLASTGGAGVNIDGTGGAGTLYIRSLANNVITEAAANGFVLDTATFDADPTTAAIDQVRGMTLMIGADNEDIAGDGLRLIDPTGDLAFTALTIFNDGGTGLFVDTKGGGTTFNLETGSGSVISTTNGDAMFLDPLSIDLAFDSVSSEDSPASGIFLDTVSGSLRIGATSIVDSAFTSIVIQNTPAPLLADFGVATIESLIGPTLGDNVDTAVGNGANLTIRFDSLMITGP